MSSKIWLASYPRSGNTLFRYVLHQGWELPTYSLYDEHWQVDIGHRTWCGQAEDWCLVKTHEKPPKTECPAVLIVRDGRDAYVSYAHYLMGRGFGDDFETTLRRLVMRNEANNQYGWSVFNRDWLRKEPVIVYFHRLAAYPFRTVRAALHELGYPGWKCGTAKRVNFKALHRQNPAHFRRGQVGAWREEMPDEIQDLFWQRHGATMERLGYARD